MHRLFIVTAVALGLAGPVHAKPYKKLTDFVDQEIGRVSKAMNSAASIEPMELGGAFEFKRILLRLTAKVGFDIEVAKIELLPELELVFQKEKCETL